MCVSYCIIYLTSNDFNSSGDYVSLSREEVGTVGKGQAEQWREIWHAPSTRWPIYTQCLTDSG